MGIVMDSFVREVETEAKGDLDTIVDLDRVEDELADAVYEITQPNRCAPAEDVDGIRTFRGLIWGVPIAIGMWAAILGGSALAIGLI